MDLMSLFRRPPTKPSEADRTMALFQIMDNADAWLAKAGPEDEAAREKVQAIRGHALRELRHDPMSNAAALPYKIVQVLYTGHIDDPDTKEESRTVVAAFADLELAEAIQEQMRPTRTDVRFMLAGVDSPIDGSPSVLLPDAGETPGPEAIVAAMRRYTDPDDRTRWIAENRVTNEQLHEAYEALIQGPHPKGSL